MDWDPILPPTASIIDQLPLTNRRTQKPRLILLQFCFSPPTHKNCEDPNVDICKKSQISKRITWIQNKDHIFLWNAAATDEKEVAIIKYIFPALKEMTL